MSEEMIRLIVGLLCFIAGGIVGFFLCAILTAIDPGGEEHGERDMR